MNIEIYLFAASLIIITVLVYMLFKLKFIIKEYERVFNINQECDFELESFFSKLPLNSYVKGIETEIKYDDFEFYKLKGEKKGKRIKKKLKYDGFDVTTAIYTKRKNEDYWLLNIYADFLSMNVFLDATLRINVIIKSFEKLETYKMHSIHELKNIIQMLKFLKHKYSIEELNSLNIKLSKLIEIQSESEKAEDITSLEFKKIFKNYLKIYPLKLKCLILKPQKKLPKKIIMVVENLMQNIYERGEECEFCFTGCKLIVKNSVYGEKPDIKNIFNPFYSSKKNSLGLGLYIVKKTVEELKGNIKCEIKDDMFVIDIDFCLH